MNWEEIKAEYETTTITLKALAEKHGAKLGTLKSRKSREGWERDATKSEDATKVATMKPVVPKTKIKEEPVFVEAEGLTDKQSLFCVYYVKSFNATQSAIKAGYSANTAHVQGPRLLGNVRVADEIRRVKAEMHQGLFIDAMDVLNKYVQIAFADISDFADFGVKSVPSFNEDGSRRFDDEGNEIMDSYNYVDFKSSSEIDGTIVTEVKQGKDGISVKLADKMKALEMLTKYFDFLPENQQRKLQEEKLKTDTEFAKARTELIKGTKKDTTLLEALIAAKGGDS
ncbi:terminase small subunit [Shouchella hunanensis]|uniref:Terminase small subunit n=1 Tax=Shouchella hunanensis TaxID=766894 RepID=A0ABY7W1X7_9BACI|nr:terminase small subunit [Shouchella hunanensis]WDF02945.1 terminase small subunit [Shouchella hunanensis]